jgi:hypothetical protein
VSSSSPGTLSVGQLPAFPFPSGVVTTLDVGAAPGYPNCEHPALVPSGGFAVPVFCIPALGFTSQLTTAGCVSGGNDGKGVVWDANDPCPDPEVSKVADTRDGVCDATTTACLTTTGPANTLGDIDTTRGTGFCDTPGVHVQLDIPGTSLTWGDGDTTPNCPDEDGVYDAGSDVLVSTFNFILSPTTDTATGAFVDKNADGCSREGQGPQGPRTITGTPSAGPCCSVGQTQTLAAVGLAFSGGGPLYDLIFRSTTPNTITACNAYGGSGSCQLPNGCFGSPSGAFVDLIE